MKFEPYLPQLPSIADLLEHPRVKGVVERINRSTLAQRAAGFIDEWRTTLAEKAGRIEIPPLSHLAERLARRLLGEPTGDGSAINATGVVVGDPAWTPPLAERAVHAMSQLAGEYRQTMPALGQTVERELCGLCGAEAAYVAGSLQGALLVLLWSAAGNREILLCGAESAGGAGGVDWHWHAARAGVVLRTAPIAATLFAAAVTPGVAAVVRAPGNNPDSTDTERRDDASELAGLSAAAKSAGASLIEVAPLAGVVDPAAHGLPSVATIKERLAAGADIVVADGSGLIGGPPCGLVVGSASVVEAARRHPLAAVFAANPLVLSALGATLASYREDDGRSVIFQIPLWQLLSTPLANLEQRARRIASLMGESSAVASAEAMDVESAWANDGARNLTAKSWEISLRPVDGDSAGLVERLAHAAVPIVPCVTDGAVHFDLRSVVPRWDGKLVEAVANEGSAAVHPTSDQPPPDATSPSPACPPPEASASA